MPSGILYKHSVELGLDISAKQLVLDIDGILTKLKNNVISFGANMEVNWSIILLLYGSQKEYETQEVAREKWSRKRQGMGQEIIWNGQ